MGQKIAIDGNMTSGKKVILVFFKFIHSKTMPNEKINLITDMWLESKQECLGSGLNIYTESFFCESYL